MAEQQRIVKLGLGKRFKDMIAAVIGQMSDGYWENTPKMRGYWVFADAGTQGDECVLEISPRTWDSVHNARNLWAAMDDAHVKRFLADKIKFLIKEEGFKWDRAGTEETDYLSYSDPYKVKDCYYAYEVLKGRNVGKHPEYSDVAEANGSKAYTFTWWDNEPTADRRPTTSTDLKNCFHKETFNAADDAEALKTAVEYLCDYIGDDPENVASTPEKIWDYFDGDWSSGDPIPMVLKQGRRVIKDSGFDPSAKGDDDDDDASEAFTAIKALFRQMVDDQGCRLLDGSDRGVEYRDQYNTKVFYMAGKLRFTFSKDDVEEEEALLDLAEKITSYGPAVITSGSDRIAFALLLPENKAIEAVKDFFEVD